MSAVNATIDGVGQLTYGLTWGPLTGYSASGLGLTTDGFLWLVSDIWSGVTAAALVTWTGCSCICTS